ncbi:rhodanese-like domain-containing protein [Paralimibaculum aggregatum]|uniref:Rhodanese-like domain-containing protein n=1 Tax=Paralimibaculum aggregatum TaxID=3036245 RepID=A0ABQ6LS43_9RHOB|nr:rhodanese-like domain-containing protein [Limibaculum sp. NKW23]GMG84430.1 rhodanese-like domain-containing protein [Limibaculum sp. NKW23]
MPLRTATAALCAALLAVAAPALAAAEDGWKKLLAPAELAERIDELVVIDIRSDKEYLTAHIPGAVNAPYPLWRGPEDNPGKPLTDAALTELLRGLGLTAETPVAVAYAGTDQSDFGAAARVYWTLKSAGLTRIAILNGGVRGWVAAGLGLGVEPVVREPSTASFALSDAWMADRADVAAAVKGERQAVLVDARPPAFFEAKRKHPAAAKAGTLEGARNLPQSGWFDGGAHEIAAAERVAALAGAAGIGEAGGEVVSFCNTGHWAATGWFAMSELAGVEGVKLYPESMVGWVNSGGAVTAGE